VEPEEVVELGPQVPAGYDIKGVAGKRPAVFPDTAKVLPDILEPALVERVVGSDRPCRRSNTLPGDEVDHAVSLCHQSSVDDDTQMVRSGLDAFDRFGAILSVAQDSVEVAHRIAVDGVVVSETARQRFEGGEDVAGQTALVVPDLLEGGDVRSLGRGEHPGVEQRGQLRGHVVAVRAEEGELPLPFP
jgi:hypothetical protein